MIKVIFRKSRSEVWISYQLIRLREQIIILIQKMMTRMVMSCIKSYKLMEKLKQKSKSLSYILKIANLIQFKDLQITKNLIRHCKHRITNQSIHHLIKAELKKGNDKKLLFNQREGNLVNNMKEDIKVPHHLKIRHYYLLSNKIITCILIQVVARILAYM